MARLKSASVERDMCPATGKFTNWLLTMKLEEQGDTSYNNGTWESSVMRTTKSVKTNDPALLSNALLEAMKGQSNGTAVVEAANAVEEKSAPEYQGGN